MCDNKPFVHLHNHTIYSVLDGTLDTEALPAYLNEHGMNAFAITDHGVMYGAVPFYRALKDKGIKPIIGLEAYVAPHRMTDRDKTDRKSFHLTLLAQNMTGYRNLLVLATKSQTEGFYGKPRIDRELLAQYSDGLIATTGCLSGQIPSLIATGQTDKADEMIGWYADVFPDRFYLELQAHDLPDQKTVNGYLINRRSHFALPLLATNDAHYLRPQDARSHEVCLAVQTGKPLVGTATDDESFSFNGTSYYVKTPAEMWDHFGMYPDALFNSILIAEQCEVNLDVDGYHLPHFDVPDGYTAGEYLRELTLAGIKQRYQWGSDEIEKRVAYELEIIDTMGFSPYFLIVWDLCRHAADMDIWYNTRGSAAGSIVAYALDISSIEPLSNGLYFERFLNPNRVSMPDIDLDFPDYARASMIAYTIAKYGDDRVAAIMTFGRMGAKAAVRDASRALGIGLDTVDAFSNLIPQEAKVRPLDEYIREQPKLRDMIAKDPKLSEMVDAAKMLQGKPRHTSVHAAGVVIGDVPLVEIVPLMRISEKHANSGLKVAVQADMDIVEKLHMLKIDFLGQTTLTAIKYACQHIAERHGITYTLNTIPFDARFTNDNRLDRAFELLASGETTGLFQVESPGMRQMLREMKPSHFQDISVAVALYRPGSMAFAKTYSLRKHGQETISYKHPALAPILNATQGVIIFQEQIMAIASQLFGYTPAKADEIRKAVSKKREKELEVHRELFVTGGAANNIPAEIALAIFDEILAFADYGFNSAHAASYAAVTIKTAFLKALFPLEYMTGVLNAYADDKEALGEYVAECRRLKIPVYSPDVNASQFDFAIEGDGIRYGLGAVKGISEDAARSVISSRPAAGYRNFDEFASQITLGKTALVPLAAVGTFDIWSHRAAAMATVLNIAEGAKAKGGKKKQSAHIQMSLFDMMDDQPALIEIPAMTEHTPAEAADMELQHLGFYLSKRPTDAYLDRLLPTHAINEILAKKTALDVVAGGIVREFKSRITSRNQPMISFKLADWRDGTNMIGIVGFDAVGAMTIPDDAVVIVSGRISEYRNNVQIVASKIEILGS